MFGSEGLVGMPAETEGLWTAVTCEGGLTRFGLGTPAVDRTDVTAVADI